MYTLSHPTQEGINLPYSRNDNGKGKRNNNYIKVAQKGSARGLSCWIKEMPQTKRKNNSRLKLELSEGCRVERERESRIFKEVGRDPHTSHHRPRGSFREGGRGAPQERVASPRWAPRGRESAGGVHKAPRGRPSRSGSAAPAAGAEEAAAGRGA